MTEKVGGLAAATARSAVREAVASVVVELIANVGYGCLDLIDLMQDFILVGPRGSHIGKFG